MSDDFIETFASHYLAVFVPVAVALVELNYEIRPWVKRTARLGIGTATVVMLGSYAVAAASFIRAR